MGSISALCPNMKLLILAIAAISTVSASKAVTCDECQAAVTDLVARLLSEESIAEQVAILKLTVCPQLPDIEARTADYMAQEETIAEGVAYLQGDCFCGQDGHTEDCGTLVSTVLPMAMPVLGAALMEQSTELCQEVV